MRHTFDRELKRESPGDQRLQYLLATVVGINLIPHTLSVPAWASGLAAFGVLYKLAALIWGYPLPRRWLLAAGVVAATAGTFFGFGTLLGVEAASCLLVLLASLKLLETNQYRDAMLVIFTSYFLLMAYLLISQTLVSTLFMACDVLFITSLMFHVHRRDRRRSARSFRPAMRMLALTIPVWLLFFFLFPRFTTAIWDLKANGTGTGFSDDLNPGAIERLAESEETAFRVQFAGVKPPSPSQLYWRGEVLTEGDGLRWHRGVETKAPYPRTLSQPPTDPTEYEVYLEPGFQRWLFVLDYVSRFQPGDYLAHTGVEKTRASGYRTSRDLQTRVTYSAAARFDAPLITALSPSEKRLLLAIPRNMTPRMTELAKRFSREEPATGEDRVQALSKRVLNYFTDGGFRYSIRPGAMNGTTGALLLDEFIFDKRRGFCEHYAAAFSTLMRMMGVPSRVVIGFQGGRYNDIGGYFIVRQLDAHAWSEVWTETEDGKGHWIRVDPTEQIAPLRISLGGEFNRLDAQSIGSFTSEELRSKVDGRLVRYWHRISLTWDALQMHWNAFLIDYDLSAQLELLGSLGFKNVSVLLLLITLAAGLLLIGALIFYLVRRQAVRPDPVAVTWQKFCRILAKRGVEKKANEGPLEYSLRAATLLDLRSDEINGIAQRYIDLRYGLAAGDQRRLLIKDFRSQVRRFSLPVFKSSSSRETSS